MDYGINQNDVRIFTLEPDQELRVVIDHISEFLTVELLEGEAEIFGVKMLKSKINVFSSSFAVFTGSGCVLKLKGMPSEFKTYKKNSIVNDLHLRFEEHRSKAQLEGKSGPIILVAGPTDVGKSTLTRSLLNYASRAGRRPLFIDLDVGQSSICIPGTMSVLPVEGSGDVVKGFSDQKISVYFFGYNSPGFNVLLYHELMNKLGKTMHSRMDYLPSVRFSGAVIDTCGWVTNQGYKSIVHAAKSFRVTSVIVLGDRILYSRIKEDLPQSVDKIFINKMEGTVVRNAAFRKNRRFNLISEYFFGPSLSFKPFSFEVNYSEVEVVRIACSKCAENKLSIVNVPLDERLMNQVLGISYCDSLDERVIFTSVLGFVCVQDISIERQSIKILSPQDKPLPKNILIMGDIKFER